jgi:hypothetical protein
VARHLPVHRWDALGRVAHVRRRLKCDGATTHGAGWKPAVRSDAGAMHTVWQG